MANQLTVFRHPEPNQKIWRYINFSKFFALVSGSNLYFSRRDRLGDPFEGEMPSFWKNSYIEIAEQKDATFGKLIKENLDKFNQTGSDLQLVNCWHINDQESFALWEIYSRDVCSVAIQSTFGGLKESFNSDQKINFGKIIYVDFDNSNAKVFISNPELFTLPILYKRKEYAFEQELRALFYVNSEDDYLKWNKDPISQFAFVDRDSVPEGYNIAVNLNSLIEVVYIHPKAPPYFGGLVRSVLKQYKYDFAIKNSRLRILPAQVYVET